MAKIGCLSFERFENFKFKLQQGLNLKPQNITAALNFFYSVPLESDCLYHAKNDPEIIVLGEIEEDDGLLFTL